MEADDFITNLEIDKALALPDTVWGHFEWFTGMVRINIDARDFENGLLTVQDKQGLEETYNHEFFHCCQICTTGFLNYYTAQFLKEIAPIWRRITEEGVLAKSTMPQILGAIFKDTPVIPETMKHLFSNMDKVGENSIITAREIIESQAYFVQKCLNDESLKHETYLNISTNAPTQEYVKAYLMASKYLGNRTFSCFNALVYSSLLFLEPQNVFEKICAKFSNYGKSNADCVMILKEIIFSLSNDHLYLGDCEAVTNKYIRNKEINPFYKPNILLLRSIGQQLGKDIFELMANPTVWFKNAITKFDVPIILNPGYVMEHTIEKNWDVYNRNYSKKLHMILGTICLIINNQHQDIAPHYLHLRKPFANVS